jgi:hypothetical protein
MQLCEVYNYYSCAHTEIDSRIKGIWENFAKMEISPFNDCANLLEKYEGRDIKDSVKADVIEPLVVFESNKDYVNQVIEEQLDLMPSHMEYKKFRDLSDDWSTFEFQQTMNRAGVPNEEIVSKANKELARRDQEEKSNSLRTR